MSDFINELKDQSKIKAQNKYLVTYSSSFKKEIKLMKKRNLDISKIKEIVSKLAKGEKLPEQNRDHALEGNFIGYRECHIESDWLLIYKIEEDKLILSLVHTGTHSDLFGK